MKWCVGAVSLAVALRMFHARYNRIADMLPAFIAVCEGEGNRQAS